MTVLAISIHSSFGIAVSARTALVLSTTVLFSLHATPFWSGLCCFVLDTFVLEILTSIKLCNRRRLHSFIAVRISYSLPNLVIHVHSSLRFKLTNSSLSNTDAINYKLFAILFFSEVSPHVDFTNILGHSCIPS